MPEQAQATMPLSQVDGNRQLNTLEAVGAKPAPSFEKERKQHDTLHAKLLKQEQSGKQSGTYVSPSDDILSPASAKLNALKEKRFSKSVKPRTLFARTPTLPPSTAEDSK